MRKLMVVLLLSLAVSFIACNGESRKEEKIIAQEDASQATEAISAQIVEQVQAVEPVQVPDVEIADTFNEINLNRYFDGINGCAVFYNPSNSEYKIYNRELSEKESSPCSTFKIMSSLMGLENGIINQTDSVYKWNGTEYWKSEWNKDIGFEEAFKASCVWYFREVINRLGEETVQDTLEQVQYGNCDISDWQGRLNTNNNNRDLTGFWIESSLKISPMGQAAVLSRVFESNEFFSEKSISLLKKVMLVEPADGDTMIYGKTGMGVKDGKCIDAWFVGMFEQDNDTIYFAVRLDDPDNKSVSSQKAKEITLDIIRTNYGNIGGHLKD